MKNNLKTSISISLVVILLVFVSIFAFRQEAQSNQQESAVIYTATNEPIEIVSLKVGNIPIQNQKKFLSTDNWLRHLNATVKNKYSKIISYVDLGVIVLRPEGQEDKLPFHYTITAGNRKKWSKRERTGFEIGFGPNNSEANLALSEPEYNDIRLSLNKLGFPANITKVQIQVEEVGFTDGTLWSIGSWYRSDPTNFRKLIPIGQKKTKKM